jgi:adenine-specific DNA-methyltransferase
MTKEQKFYKALQDVFVGAKIEGEGGFINLMRIKAGYYSQIEKLLKEDINQAVVKYPAFREELFDKLYSFFSRYFTESGSIYFNSTPFHNNIYEKVYTDEKDVILFWKTQMLYYVKTDRIFRSLPVEFDGLKFYFDASKIESKKANEKRSLVFELDKVKEDGTIVFGVQYSERNTKTKQDEILKAIKSKGIAISEEQLERAFRVFEKQSEVDFFINKNAKAFLQEQFKLWSYQYFWEGAKEWSADRINQLQILKDIAFKIIDFISQFEDELVKIWNKPKFVKNSNYVITLDRILFARHYEKRSDEAISLVEKIKKHKNYPQQVKEWEELGIVDKDSDLSVIARSEATKQSQSEYSHLPIDTKYFKDLELEILSLFDDLDNQLDGWLIKSENYQALNTILPKFKEKVQTIYIDPPFNTGEDFDYIDKFQDSTWITLMENRLSISKEFLNKEGSYWLHLDPRANYFGRMLMNQIFGKDNFINEVIWAYEKARYSTNKFKENHETLLLYSKDEHYYFQIQYVPRKGDEDLKKRIGKYELDYEGKISPDYWVDIPSFATAMTSGERSVKMIGLYFETQKPEKLLKRVIETVSNEGDLVTDFFLGSGTTTAVAHKLGRKWIGVEMGEHFYTVVLPRMKKVLAYDKSGISKEVKEYQGGGFFKYYELEQYEEALANCKYEDGDLFNVPGRSPYQEYVFMKDEKMLKALEIDYKNKKVKVDLTKLYPDIDIAETLSNLTGKWIRAIKEDEVEFTDGSKINTKELDYKLIKPLIWWE